MMKLVVLASGRGSNFAAIADAIRRGEIPDTRIAALISNRADAPALELARQRGIPTEVVESRKFRFGGKLDRTAYEAELARAVARFEPDYLCLAGYLLILGAEFIRRWPLRILNIHPSLLPAFKGLHAQQQALDAGVEWTGCTVHLVTEDLDAGPILAQTVLPVREDDTAESLAARLLPLEHQTYVRALAKLATTAYDIQGSRVLWRTQPNRK